MDQLRELHSRVKGLLTKSKIPAEDIKVFGAMKTNIHIHCRGRETAKKWSLFLGGIHPESKTSITKTWWERKTPYRGDGETSNGSLVCVTKTPVIHGYLIVTVF